MGNDNEKDKKYFFKHNDPNYKKQENDTGEKKKRSYFQGLGDMFNEGNKISSDFRVKDTRRIEGGKTMGDNNHSNDLNLLSQFLKQLPKYSKAIIEFKHKREDSIKDPQNNKFTTGEVDKLIEQFGDFNKLTNQLNLNVDQLADVAINNQQLIDEKDKLEKQIKDYKVQLDDVADYLNVKHNEVKAIDQSIKRLTEQKVIAANELQAVNVNKTTLINEINQLKASKDKVTTEIEALKLDKQTVSNELEQLTNIKIQLESHIQQLNVDKSNINKEIEELKTIEQQARQVIENLSNEFNQLKEYKSKLDDTVNELDKYFANLQQQVSETELIKNNLNNEINELNTVKNNLNTDIEGLNTDKNNLINDVKELSENKEQALKEKSDVETQIIDLTNTLQFMKSLETLVTTVATKEDVKEVSDKLDTATEQLTVSVQNIELPEIPNLDASMEVLNNGLATLTTANEQVATVTQDLLTTFEEIKEEGIKNEIDKARAKEMALELNTINNKAKRYKRELTDAKFDLAKTRAEFQAVANVYDITQNARYNAELDKANYIQFMSVLGIPRHEAEFLYTNSSSNLIKLMNESVKLVEFDSEASFKIAQYFEKYFTEMVYMITPETQTFIERFEAIQELSDAGAIISIVVVGKIHKLDINPKFLEDLGETELLDEVKMSLATVDTGIASNYLKELLPPALHAVVDQAVTMASTANQSIYYTFNLLHMMDYDVKASSIDKYIEPNTAIAAIDLKARVNETLNATRTKVDFLTVANELQERLWFINEEWLTDQFATTNKEELSKGQYKLSLVARLEDNKFAHRDTIGLYDTEDSIVDQVKDVVTNIMVTSRTETSDYSTNPFINVSTLIPSLFTKKEVRD